MNCKNIPIECYPAYGWLWNGTITREEINRQIDEMYDAGIRAFYVIGEPEEFRPQSRRTHLSPEYLSSEYFDLLYYAYEIADRKGMNIWLYNEGGYPSGSACGQIRKEHPELAVKLLDTRRKLLKAGEVFIGTERLISAFAGAKRICEGESFSEDTEITEYVYVDGIGIKTDNGSLRNTELFLELTHERMKKDSAGIWDRM